MNIADSKQRQQVVAETNCSFVITAPAGSGKTELLVQRVLALLCQCRQPESILMITFTKKATAEMKQRIISALQLTAEQQADKLLPITYKYCQKVLQRSEELGWNLTNNGNRLNIKTLDSFCAYLAQNCPIESQCSNIQNVKEDTTSEYQMAIDDFIVANSKLFAKAIAILLNYCENSYAKLSNLLIDFLRNRLFINSFIDNKNLSRQQIANNLKLARNFHFQQLKQTLDSDFLQRLQQSWNYVYSNLIQSNPDFAKVPRDLASCNITELILIINTLVLTKKPEVKKTINKSGGFPLKDAAKQEHLDFLETIRGEPNLVETLQQLVQLPQTNPLDELDLVAALLQILQPLYRRLDAIFKKENCCDFNFIAYAAKRAIGSAENPTDLTLKLDYTIEHILVDEFQDTSNFQLDLLKVLMSGWQNDDGRTFFFVGDTMQSIYSFRDAEIELFNEVCIYGINDLPFKHLKLSSNFRSQAGIVNWVNANFKNVAQPSVAIKGIATKDIATKIELNNTDDSVQIIGKTTAAEEIDFICNQIKAIIATADNNTIAVLVRYRDQIPFIANALTTNDIAINATETQKLNSQFCILDIASLCQCLYFEHDRLSWIALLRSPLIGLTAKDILFLTRNLNDAKTMPSIWHNLQHYRQIPNLSQPAMLILKKVVPILAIAMSSVGIVKVTELIQKIWSSLGGNAIYTLVDEKSYLDLWLSLLAQYFPGLIIDNWNNFADRVATQYVSLTATADNAVELMTIHKAKGLEFDYVFIPHCQKNTKRPPTTNTIKYRVFRQQQQQLPIIINQNSNLSNCYYDWMRAIATTENFRELQRLFYVGCTRSKQRLYITFNTEKTTAKPKSLLSWVQNSDNYFDNIPKHIAQDIAADDSAIALQKLTRLPADFKLEPPNFIELSAGQTSNSADKALAGILMHRALQYIEPNNNTNYKLIKQLLIADADELGLDNCETFCSQIISGLIKTANDATGKWILNNRHFEAANELEIIINGGDTPKKFIIDRTFIADGYRWIIDYKSIFNNSKLSDLQLRDMLKYQKQLQQYRQLFVKLQPEVPVKTMLYFPIQAQHIIVNC